MTSVITPAVVEAFQFIDIADDWPDNATLFEPCENEQVLMYEFAECLSTRTFLRMCELPCRTEHRPNAEAMSPSGNVPFLRVGNVIVSDFLPIVDLVARKGVNLSENLTQPELADMHACIATVHEVLRSAEIWACWMHAPSRTQITIKRSGAVYPFPLNQILPRMKYRTIHAHLQLTGWADKKMEQVIAEVDATCSALSHKLGEASWFCGETPTELDALAFGHLFTLLSTDLPEIDLAAVVDRYPNLRTFTDRCETTYYKSKRR